MRTRKTYTYTRENFGLGNNIYVTEIFTKEELLERENSHEAFIEPKDYPVFVNVKEKIGGFYEIESIDGDLYIETGNQTGKGPSNFFRYKDREYYITGRMCSKNYARLPWTWRELFILKVCANYELSAEIISQVLLRSTRNIISKAKELKYDIRLFEGYNPRSEGIIKYYEKMREMYEAGYKFERIKMGTYSKDISDSVYLRGTGRIPYKNLGYFYKDDYNN